MGLRTLIAQKLCCFFDSALERCGSQPRPAVVHLLKSVAMSKHIDDLGNSGIRLTRDTCNMTPACKMPGMNGQHFGA